ncbi:2-keto-4-pentenoate hydratase/2-oxohepta-3-ene-1,7-dioic acid hydratase in catechol pathway [Agromyces albus]|nr:2-keto-4-pentenoate hydratase/2-oxohepta-3-ene-1,7-dioic acid hydratase in catechol pathway [Agromyces albus]
MRIARWRYDGAIGEGFVVGDDAVPFPRGLTVADVLAAGLAELPALAEETDAAASVPLGDVTLLAPLVPMSVRDFVAFEEHVEGVTASIDGASRVVDEWYEFPTFYFTNPHSIVATGDEVRPPATGRLDFELEVGAVIGGVAGSDGRDLSPDEAAGHVFGYTIFNDWSARDIQGREMKVRLGPAKGKDFATTLGPWIVTADEFAGLLDDEGFLPIGMEVFVNGDRIGHDLLSNMGWPFGDLIAYASRNSRVVPGDVLGSGTAGNGGCLAELWGRAGELIPPPLAAGDEVVMRVEGIGEIRNTVGRAVHVPEIPPARHRSRARSRG